MTLTFDEFVESMRMFLIFPDVEDKMDLAVHGRIYQLSRPKNWSDIHNTLQKNLENACISAFNSALCSALKKSRQKHHGERRTLQALQNRVVSNRDRWLVAQRPPGGKPACPEAAGERFLLSEL